MQANFSTALFLGAFMVNALVGQHALATDTQPLQIDVTYVYRHVTDDQFKTLTEGSTLYSGDFYKIIFTPIEPAYVYIFQTDSSDKIYRLFPMGSFKNIVVNNFNPVHPGKTYYIPAKDKSFFLDQQIGEETFYLIASRQPDKVLENQYQQVINTQKRGSVETEIAQASLQREIKTRGMGGIAVDSTFTQNQMQSPNFNWEEEGQQFTTLRQHLKACDGCVSVLKFWHR